MQSIRSRRTSTCLSSGPLGSGSGLLQTLGSGMVRLTSASGISSPVHQQYNGNTLHSSSNNTSINNLNYGGHAATNRNATTTTNPNSNYVRKCPSLNITFTTHWLFVRACVWLRWCGYFHWLATIDVYTHKHRWGRGEWGFFFHLHITIISIKMIYLNRSRTFSNRRRQFQFQFGDSTHSHTSTCTLISVIQLDRLPL